MEARQPLVGFRMDRHTARQGWGMGGRGGWERGTTRGCRLWGLQFGASIRTGMGIWQGQHGSALHQSQRGQSIAVQQALQLQSDVAAPASPSPCGKTLGCTKPCGNLALGGCAG